MSLVYFITSLPKLNLGQPAPISREDFVASARKHLTGEARKDFELTLLVEEVERTTGILYEEMIERGEVGTGKLGGLIRQGLNAAKRRESEVPEWVLKARPYHLLMRQWYRSVYNEAQSPFLREWTRFSLNLDEVTAGLLCKMEGMSADDFLRHMEGGFDSSWRVMVAHYDDADLGVGKRFAWYSQVKEALSLDDPEEMEKRLNRIRWKAIDACLGTDLFSMDTVLAYYFRLRILEREASWDVEKGSKILDEILAHTPGGSA